MSTHPERPAYEQTQRMFSSSTPLTPGLVEAATLLSYLTMRDAEDRDIPAAASSRARKNTDFYLGAVLMDLALQGRVRMDETTPLENHVFDYEQRQKQRSLKRLWFVVPPLALFLAGVIAFWLSQQLLASIFFFSFMAYILVTILLVIVLGVLLRVRGKTARGKLRVVNPTPTGNTVMDEVLRQMLSTGESRQVYRWLYGRGSLKADGLYKFTERRLVEQGWITLTGVSRVFLLGEVETLVINRHTEQWQQLSNQVRSTLLMGDNLSPEMLALLLCLTIFGETFYTPRQIRFPGQPSGRKIVSGLYQFFTSPEELTIARQRLQALMQGDQVVAAAIGYPLYDTLLSIRNGIERSVESRQQTSAG